MNQEENKVILNCMLCGAKELHVTTQGEEELFQCLSCGYSTSHKLQGTIEANEHFKTLDEDLQKWAKEEDDYIWIPSVMNLSVGIYYPADVGGKMMWAMAPIVQIPESERKDYPVPNQEGKFYSKRYDIENPLIFDNFGKGLKTINDTLEKQKAMHQEAEPKIVIEKVESKK